MTIEPLSPEEVARVNADVHAGYELVSYGEIGLPYYELRLRAQVLDRKPIDPFAEFVCRSLELGIGELDELQSLLGINTRVLNATIVDLAVKEHVVVGNPPDRLLTLTTRGRHVLADAAEIAPASMTISVNYDALVQAVVAPFGDFLTPKDMKERGIREIPVPARLQPELHRLDVRDVERVVREIGGGREQLRDILAIKSMRRFRVFRSAVALVFRSTSSTDCLVDIVIDGQRSERHALAFAEVGLPRKLGIVGEIKKAEIQVSPFVGEEVATILRDEDRNSQIRELKRILRSSRRLADDAHAPAVEKVEANGQRAAAVKKAQEIFDEQLIQAVDTFEHPQHLSEALEKTRRRLIIISPWLRAGVVDHRFLSKLENLLHKGVDVYIGWGISRDEREEPNADKRVLEKLQKLAKTYKTLHVHRLGNTHAKVLISDERYIIVTSFNWLSFRGDPKRTFRDERGTLISKPVYVQEQAEDWIRRLNEASRLK